MTDQPQLEQKLELTFENLLDAFDGLFEGSTFIAANCLKKLRIMETKKPVDTLAVDHEGTIYVNREFFYKYCTKMRYLQAFLLHELMHHITGDVYEFKKLDKKSPLIQITQLVMNIAMDARINAFIHRYMPQVDALNAFGNIYRDADKRAREEGQELSPDRDLLNPEISTTGWRLPGKEVYKTIFDFLYFDRNHDRIISYRDIYDMLLNQVDLSKCKIIVVGGHGEVGDEDGGGMRLPKELEKAAEELVKNAGRGGTEAGYSKHLRDMVLNETQGTGGTRIDMSVIRRLGFNNLFRNIRGEIKKYDYQVSKAAVPKNITRSDFFRLCMGWTPFMWDVKSKVPIKEDICAPIYLDVSGSMHRHLPEIIQLIVNVDKDISYVWGFSNEVHKHDMQMLRDGNLKSTWGTDFDCVIDHAIEHGFRNIVIVTDGYAGTRHPPEYVLRHLNEVIVILTRTGRTRENFFTKNYKKTYSIEEVTV